MTQKEIKDSFENIPVGQLLQILPAEIIKGRKNFFHTNEVFDLTLRKSKVFNTWTVEYYNDRTVKTLLQHQSPDLTKCLVEMIFELIELKYITI